MVTRFSRPIAFSAFLALAGCTATVDHPSLAPRAIERFNVAEPSTQPPLPVKLPEDASRQERALMLAAQAREADARFRQRLAEAESGMAGDSGAVAGGESWVQAQEAISSAEALREPVTSSLADLEALQIAAIETGIGTEAESSLTGIINEIEALDAAESTALSTMKARLSNP